MLNIEKEISQLIGELDAKDNYFWIDDWKRTSINPYKGSLSIKYY